MNPKEDSKVITEKAKTEREWKKMAWYILDIIWTGTLSVNGLNNAIKQLRLPDHI